MGDRNGKDGESLTDTYWRKMRCAESEGEEETAEKMNKVGNN